MPFSEGKRNIFFFCMKLSKVIIHPNTLYYNLKPDSDRTLLTLQNEHGTPFIYGSIRSKIAV